jgi:hypothetical protein
MSSKIVPVKQSSLFRSLDQLVEDADHIAERHANLQNLRRAVRQRKAALENGEVVSVTIDGKQAALSQYDEKVLERCDGLFALLDPPESYEDNDREGDLRREVVSVRLASLIGAFPNGQPSDPEVYVRLLLEHVSAVEGLNLLALDTACRKIVATQKFLPTVSEVIGVLGEQQEKWNDRLWAYSNIEETSTFAMQEIEALKAEAELAAKTRALHEAQRQHSNTVAAVIAAQEQAAKAAQLVASRLAVLGQCEAALRNAEQALAELGVERNQ